MKVTCQVCKIEVLVEMYYYDKRIDPVRFTPDDPVEYRASVKAKTICPCCGADIHEIYSSLISDADIVQLAIGRKGDAE